MDKRDLEIIKRIKRYCLDIAWSINRFGNSFDIFSQDTDFYNTVSINIMRIGELSAGLSDGFKGATRSQMMWS